MPIINYNIKKEYYKNGGIKSIVSYNKNMSYVEATTYDIDGNMIFHAIKDKSYYNVVYYKYDNKSLIYNIIIESGKKIVVIFYEEIESKVIKHIKEVFSITQIYNLLKC